MAYLNISIVAGFVGDEPKVISTKNDSVFVTFSLATTKRGFTKKDGTVIADKTDWHNIVVFGSLAKIAQKYIHKGTSLLVRGELHSRKYTDNNNVTRYVTEIEAADIQMLDKKSDASPATEAAQQPQQPQNVSPQIQSAINTLEAAGFNFSNAPKTGDDLPF